MEKLILPIFLAFLALSFAEFSYAQDYQVAKDCLKERHNAEYQCGQIHKACVNRCSGQTISECIGDCFDDKHRCEDAAKAEYNKCLNQQLSEKQTKKTAPVQEPARDQIQAPAEQPVSQSKSKKDGNIFNIFGINPFETWLNLKELAQLPELWLDATKTTEILVLEGLGKSGFIEEKYGKGNVWGSVGNKGNQVKTEVDPNAVFKFSDLPKRTPELTEEIVRRAQEEWKKTTELGSNKQVSPYSIDILRGQAQIKYPNEQEWTELKPGDKIPSGSTIFTGMDTTTILSIRDKGVVQVQSFAEITVNERGLEEAAKTGQTYTDIKLEKGEIEINIDPYVPTTPSDKPGFQGWGMSIYGPFYSAAVRGTHFWVSQEENKQQAAIGVYEGKVEVKASGSDKSMFISPGGDKPGIVVITQKLSPIKMAIAGLVLVVVIGGVCLILKRKFSAKGSNKKRK